MVNLSNFSVEVVPGVPIEIQAVDLVRDYVTKINDKIVLIILLMFTAMILGYIVLPRSKRGIESLLHNPFFSSFKMFLDGGVKVINWLISFSDTVIIGGCGFLFGIAYFQGVIGHKSLMWAIILFGVIMFTFIIEGIGYVRKLNKKVVVEVEDG